MKKLCLCLFASLLLVGCGGTTNEKSTKTCSTDMDGISIDVVMDAEGSTLTKASMKYTAPYASMDVTKEDMEGLGDEGLAMLEQQIMSEMGIKEDDGWSVESSLEAEALKVSVSGEVGLFEKAFNATKVEDLIKEFETEGFTCK